MKISNFELKIYFDWIFPADYPHRMDCYLTKVPSDTWDFPANSHAPYGARSYTEWYRTRFIDSNGHFTVLRRSDM